MRDRQLSPTSSPTPTRRRLLLSSAVGATALTGVGGSLLSGVAAAERLPVRTADLPLSAERTTFDETDLALNGGDGYKDATNEQALYAWQESYVLQSYALMYRAHRDTYYLDKFVDHAESVLANRDSVRGVADYRGESLPLWRNFAYSVDGAYPILAADETGNLLYPLTMFARVVAATPKLWKTYGGRAARYAAACIQAVEAHEEIYRDRGDGSATYFFPKGLPYPWDGIEYAQNKNLSMARALLNLSLLTGVKAYRAKGIALGRFWQRDLQTLADGAPFWTYQERSSWGYRGWTEADAVSENSPSFAGNTRIEDIGHAHLPVEFAEVAYAHHALFSRADLTALARTLTRHALATHTDGSPSVHVRIDGSEGTGNQQYELHTGLWVPLAPYAEDDVITLVGAVLDDNIGSVGPGRLSRFLVGSAMLNFVGRGGRVSRYDNTPPKPAG
jgi:hypothetical protein